MARRFTQASEVSDGANIQQEKLILPRKPRSAAPGYLYDCYRIKMPPQESGATRTDRRQGAWGSSLNPQKTGPLSTP